MKQTIHFNREGNATCSVNDSTKYLCESRNLDICVADVAARAVVDHTGALKSKNRLKGHPSKLDQKYTSNLTALPQTARATFWCLTVTTTVSLSWTMPENTFIIWGLCFDKNDFLFELHSEQNQIILPVIEKMWTVFSFKLYIVLSEKRYNVFLFCTI